MVIEKSLNYSIIKSENNNINTENIHNINLKISENKGMYIIHRTLIQQLHNKRQRTVNTKTRSEVRGGGKKPWKQKGTGKARAGSIRSPLWRGGGVIFGPKPKDNKKKINKKEKQLALRTILYNKFENTFVINDLFENWSTPNTKLILNHIHNIGIQDVNNTKILIIIANQNTNLYLSIRNLKNIELINGDQLNILALLKADKLIITVNALDKINKTYNH